MPCAVFAGPQQHANLGERWVDGEGGSKMRLRLVRLACKEQQDAEVGLRVEVLGFSRDHCGELRNGQLGPLLAQVGFSLLLMQARLLGC